MNLRYITAFAFLTSFCLAGQFVLPSNVLDRDGIVPVTYKLAGQNALQVRTATSQRVALPIHADRFHSFAADAESAEYISEQGQGWVRSQDISGSDAGGRFLDLRDGLAPDKLTAEVRKVAPWPAKKDAVPAASIAWALEPGGPWQTLWTYDPKLVWKDGEAIDRTLRWPEVDRQVRSLPAGTRRVYVRYTFDGMGIDDFRLAYVRSGLAPRSPLNITHVWRENGVERRHTERLGNRKAEQAYTISVPSGATVINSALILERPASSER